MSDGQNEASASASHGASTTKESIDYADQMKNEGNELFRAGKWEEALAAYRVGLGSLPKRKSKPSRPREESDDEEPVPQTELKGEDEQSKRTGKRAERGRGESPFDNEEPQTELKREDEQTKGTGEQAGVDSLEIDPFSKSRAVLNANIAACFMKLGDDKEVVAACSQSLYDDPHYIKALQRRATSNEKLNTWSSLSSAQEDYRKLIELLPESSSERTNAQRKLIHIKPRVEEAQKKETAEMMSKLKGVGNSILGRFGLSTDNFQFVPNGQGGYSMNFQK
ncbi:hypothetical protein E1B28_011116 [Marasmius oreades]|uniref:Tetratricopeptide repeat protein 1 n=1 Tax=Marasmius oreades TaxID=181124 RepID=A0A9P7RTJ2_9AGAR|nr:uncharacterized protein E1B28_011116 [Marasmius oreades]KAG7089430.1 hypothetical protein E1B28_011116 [Marasmius oreades]